MYEKELFDKAIQGACTALQQVRETNDYKMGMSVAQLGMLDALIALSYQVSELNATVAKSMNKLTKTIDKQGDMISGALRNR